MKDYTASKSLPPGRNVWVVSFRHPLRKDPRGKFGLKVRRSLGTSNEAEAEQLLSHLNTLLSDKSWHSLVRRAEAERRFGAAVASAFYDALENPVGDPIEIRDTKVPFSKSGVPKVLLAGVTGSGKTSLLRHFIGSDPKDDRFPSTSTSRTTTCDIEIMIARRDTAYSAVVTFRSQWEVTAKVAECVSSACLAALHKSSDEKIADRLLHHTDQTFRLSYILGSYAGTKTTDDTEWGFEGEPISDDVREDSGDIAVLPNQQAAMQTVLRDFVDRARRLAEAVRAKVEQDLAIDFGSLSPADRDVAEEYFVDDLEDRAEFDDLVADIVDQILSRFDYLPAGTRSNRPGGWPESWSCDCDVSERNEFIRRIRWFTNNHASAFGRLVTPLVEGIRARGPFESRIASETNELILFDSQGFGHTPESSASVSTQMTRRYADVDAILLVDNAKQAMLPASVSILRSVLASGYQRKLAIVFTHGDQVSGPNMRDFPAKRAYVIESVVGALHGLHGVLGAALVGALEENFDQRCFIVGWLDKPISGKSKGLAREVERLLGFCQDAILPEIPTEAVPVYDLAGLNFAAQSADNQFQELWKARLGRLVLAKVPKKPWQTIKALNRRVALAFDNSEYGDLRPAAELVACLSESIGRFLDKPLGWHGPSEARQRQAAIDKVRQGVFAALHKFVADHLLAAPMPDWVKAYELSGWSSTFSRANAIEKIVEAAAPVPNEAMSREVAAFLSELRGLVYVAIKNAGGLISAGEVATDIPA